MMKRPLLALLTLAPFSLILSACAGLTSDGHDYPSLAKRPIEQRGMDDREQESAPAVESPVAADPALKTQLAALVRQAEQGKAKFDRLYRDLSGQIRAGRNAAVSSETWVGAQMGLSRLEQARYDSVYALASLDTLYAAQRQAISDGKAAGGIEELATARSVVLAIVDAQNDRIDGLKGRRN